jgi:diaminohydroxyphosphoribosylaminopyrimidine deaminase/5-amino-6-(5-phosphoribosylamino)uracil reductase
MTVSEAEQVAMRRARRLAGEVRRPTRPNPMVGCVLLGPDGSTIAEGTHHGAGTPHAEVDALAKAGAAARGSTAVVTLEPCDHRGRTGPCTQALIDAGVARVVYGQADPNPVAAGGADTLRAAGVDVVGGVDADEARSLNSAWTRAQELGRPHVLWKFATTLDGRSAAADGTSRWVSSVAARMDTHRLRAGCDTMLVGTNTVEVDDPLLTVRPYRHYLSREQQPLRVVMGERDLDPDRRIFDDQADTLHLRTRDPHEALAHLHGLGRYRVFLEGGPTLAAAFLQARLVDTVVVYVAPMLLGSGPSAVADLGIATIADALHLPVVDVAVLEPNEPDEPDDETNVRITLGGSTMKEGA